MRLAVFSLALAIFVGGPFMASGCTPAARKEVVVASLDVASAACVIAHAELADAEVLQICDIADELLPVVRKLIESTRAQSRQFAQAKLAAARCSEAGAP